MTTAKKEPVAKIYKALNSILSEIGAITKDKKNKTQGFMYRGIDQVYDTVHPLLAQFKVIVLPEVLTLEHFDRVTANGKPMQATKVTVRYTFVAEDGSNVTMTMAGEGMDMADKSTAKAVAVAQKYAFFQMFCIPVSDAVDGDEESLPASTPAQQDPAPTPVAPPPVAPVEITPAEHALLEAAAHAGSNAFRVAWRNIGHPLIVSVEQTALWKNLSVEADKKLGENG